MCLRLPFHRTLHAGVFEWCAAVFVTKIGFNHLGKSSAGFNVLKYGQLLWVNYGGWCICCKTTNNYVKSIASTVKTWLQLCPDGL
jgi:hypothetical protein